MKEYFKEGLEKIKVSYDENKIEKALKYLEILLDYNSHTNLTAIREEKAIIEKHFLDSLLLQNLLKEEDKTCLLYTSPSPRDSTSSRMPSSA